VINIMNKGEGAHEKSNFWMGTLSDCFINNALIHFVLSCQDTCTQFVNVLDPLLVDLLLHYRPHFVVDRIYIRALGGMKSGVSILSSSTVSRAL